MKHDKGSHADSNRLELEKQIQELQRDIRDLKLEHDLLKKANELLKKTWASTCKFCAIARRQC